MKEKGKVISLEKGVALVETEPAESCSKCCSCGAGKPRRIMLSGDKAAGLKVGDTVEIEVAASSMLRVYLVLYAFPLTVFLAAVFGMYYFTSSPLASFLTGITALAIAFSITGYLFRKSSPLLPDICVRKE